MKTSAVALLFLHICLLYELTCNQEKGFLSRLQFKGSATTATGVDGHMCTVVGILDFF